MSLAGKLQIRPGQRVAVLHAPEDVDIGVATVGEDAAGADAVVVFVANRAELEELGGALTEAARRDALAWLAYPKAGRLGTDINRDVLRDLLTARGVRPVRQVSIDDVWSALRFRPA